MLSDRATFRITAGTAAVDRVVNREDGKPEYLRVVARIIKGF
jgi:hypothetical protein